MTGDAQTSAHDRCLPGAAARRVRTRPAAAGRL